MRNILKFIEVNLLALVAGCTFFECGPLVVASHEEGARYSIVLTGTEIPPSAKYAAEELRDYVKRITDITLPIVTNVTPKRGLYLSVVDEGIQGTDSFRLSVRGRDLFITGDKRGVLYGVYEILERFGDVDWFASWREVVPKATHFTIPATLNETHAPIFRMRGSSFQDVRMHQAFAARLRMNMYTSEEKYGGREGLFVKGLGSCHTFNKLVPYQKYFKDHPEYFSEVNGVRRDGQTQLCLTNPDVLEIVVSNVLAAIEKDPEAQMVGISQNDWGYYCTCAKCKAIDEEEGSPSGSLIRFLNAVAKRVTAKYPKMLVETLAYQYTRKPPKKTRLHPAVVPCLCSIECDFSRPLASDEKKANQAFVEDIRGWAKMTDNLYLWDYTTNYRHYMHPFANEPVLQDNIRFFRDNHVKFLFEEGGGYHADLCELKTYLMAKWMWHPEYDRTMLEERFCEGYFGKAAPFAKEYLRKYHACCARQVKSHQGCFAFDDATLFDDDFIAWAEQNWQKAAEAVKDDPDALYAVHMAEATTLAVKLHRWNARVPRVWATRNPQQFVIPKKEIAATYARLEAFQKEAQAHKHEFRLGNLKVRHEGVWRHWKNMYDECLSTKCAPSNGTGVVTFKTFDNWNEARGDVAKDAASITAEKKAMRVVNYVDAPCVYFNLSNLAFDKEGTYRVRFRAKAHRVSGGKGEAFWAHLGNHTKAVRAEELKGDYYMWYDLGTFKLNPSWRFEFSNGRYKNGGGRLAVKESRIDVLEFTRVK